MAKQKTVQLTSKELKKECQYIMQDAIEEIHAICQQHIEQNQKELKKNKTLLKKHKLKLKELNKKNKKIETDLKKKKSDTLKNRLKTTKIKTKELNKTINLLDKSISRLTIELSEYKAIKNKEKARDKALRELKKQQNAQPTMAAKKTTTKKKLTKTMTQPKQKSLPMVLPDMPELQAGDIAPEITTLISSNQTLPLEQYKGKNVVLYFYPKDSTPGCTKQAIDFSANIEKFSALETVVIGVSRDSLQSHENFKKKHQLNLTLLSDPDESLCQAFGVIRNKNSFGKVVRGIERSTFLINKAGKIQKIWRKVKVTEHADDVLSSLADTPSAS